MELNPSASDLIDTTLLRRQKLKIKSRRCLKKGEFKSATAHILPQPYWSERRQGIGASVWTIED
jgi:hypothetical protein